MRVFQPLITMVVLIHPVITAVRSQYKWRLKKYSQCSVTCGQGLRIPLFTCYSSKTGNTYSESTCISAGRKKPRLPPWLCGDPCPKPMWNAGPWGKCSPNCTDTSTQHREVACVELRPLPRFIHTLKLVKLSSAKCAALPEKPVDRRPCDLVTCRQRPKEIRPVINPLTRNIQKKRKTLKSAPGFASLGHAEPVGTYAINDWSDCSKTCGNGISWRDVGCYGGECKEPVPPSQKACNIQPCPSFSHVEFAPATMPTPLTMPAPMTLPPRTPDGVPEPEPVKVVLSQPTSESRCEDKSSTCPTNANHHHCATSDFKRLCCKSCTAFLEKNDTSTCTSDLSDACQAPGIQQYCWFKDFRDLCCKTCQDTLRYH